MLLLVVLRALLREEIFPHLANAPLRPASDLLIFVLEELLEAELLEGEVLAEDLEAVVLPAVLLAVDRPPALEAVLLLDALFVATIGFLLVSTHLFIIIIFS